MIFNKKEGISLHSKLVPSQSSFLTPTNEYVSHSGEEIFPDSVRAHNLGTAGTGRLVRYLPTYTSMPPFALAAKGTSRPPTFYHRISQQSHPASFWLRTRCTKYVRCQYIVFSSIRSSIGSSAATGCFSSDETDRIPVPSTRRYWHVPVLNGESYNDWLKKIPCIRFPFDLQSTVPSLYCKYGLYSADIMHEVLHD